MNGAAEASPKPESNVEVKPEAAAPEPPKPGSQVPAASTNGTSNIPTSNIPAVGSILCFVLVTVLIAPSLQAFLWQQIQLVHRGSRR